MKCYHREEFVIVGYSDPKGSRPHLGVLLLAYYTDEYAFLTFVAILLIVAAVGLVRDIVKERREKSSADQSTFSRVPD